MKKIILLLLLFVAALAYSQEVKVHLPGVGLVSVELTNDLAYIQRGLDKDLGRKSINLTTVYWPIDLFPPSDLRNQMLKHKTKYATTTYDDLVIVYKVEDGLWYKLVIWN